MAKIGVSEELANKTVADILTTVDNMRDSIKTFDETMNYFFTEGYASPKLGEYKSRIEQLVRDFEPFYNKVQEFASVISQNKQSTVEADQ